MGVAILLVYLMMVLTFNSLVTPFIILFSLPLATIGAFPALLITDRPIGLSALIGFLMLIGIVVTNAIVLLDLVERLRAEGHSTQRRARSRAAGPALRPILMTAIATILALVPLAAGFNQGSIIAAELGTVVIGGLLSSTFLTLLVIPAIYSLVDGLKERLARRGATETIPKILSNAFDVERDAERRRRAEYAEMARPDAEPDPEPIATTQGAAMAKASPRTVPGGPFWRAIRRLTGTA